MNPAVPLSLSLSLSLSLHHIYETKVTTRQGSTRVRAHGRMRVFRQHLAGVHYAALRRKNKTGRMMTVQAIRPANTYKIQTSFMIINSSNKAPRAVLYSLN
jgi:hypothetical protein